MRCKNTLYDHTILNGLTIVIVNMIAFVIIITVVTVLITYLWVPAGSSRAVSRQHAVNCV